MDEEDGEIVVALDGAERAEDSGDLGGGVFVDAGQADEGIEHEQAGALAIDDRPQAVEVLLSIEAQGGDVEQIDGEWIDGESGDGGEPVKAGPQGVQAVFGAVEENGAAETGRSSEHLGVGGHGESDLGGQEGLSHLGGSAQDADSGGQPEIFDQPLLVGWQGFDLGEMPSRERLHGGMVFRVHGGRG
jgi:hypothetical protein